MSKQHLIRRRGTPRFLQLAVLLLAGCGGGGNSGTPAAPTPVVPVRYAVGGTVTGLATGATVTVSNGAEALSVTANGQFTFPTRLEAGAAFSVSAANPAGHVCKVKDGAGSIGGADATKATVSCTPFVLAGVQGAIASPAGVAIDAAGNAFVIDSVNQLVMKVSSAGVVSALAGTSAVRGSKDGIGGAASFNFNGASRLVIDTTGNLIATDTCNGLLRKITQAGVVSTIAGSPQRNCLNYYYAPLGDSTDGTGAAARFSYPTAIAIDAHGKMAVVDYGSPSIREVTPAGVVTTARYLPRSPQTYVVTDLAFDPSGTLYMSSTGGGSKFWKVQAGTAVFVAGGATLPPAPALPPDGAGSAAGFRTIRGVAADKDGSLVIADGSLIRRMTAAGVVTTLAGGAETVPVNGPGSAARFGSLAGLALDGSGNAVVAEADQGRLRLVSPLGVASAFGAMPMMRDYVDGQGAAARLSSSTSLTAGPDGTLYITDALRHVVRKVSPTGEVSLLAGIPGSPGTANGAAAAATFTTPRAVTVDKDGVVYVADANGIRKIAAGVVSQLAGAGMHTIFALAVDSDGNLAATNSAEVYRITPSGAVTVLVDADKAAGAVAAGANFGTFIPIGVVADTAGNLYIADEASAVVFKYSKAGVLSVFAGTPNVEGDVDGAVGIAKLGFYSIDFLTIDEAGNLYLSGQDKLRKISPVGVVSTPVLPWGTPVLQALAYSKGTLYGTTYYAILQTPVE